MSKLKVRMNDFFPLVRDDFDGYEKLRECVKTVIANPLEVSRTYEESKKLLPYMGRADIFHFHQPLYPCRLEIEICTKAIPKYALKIFSSTFGGAPCMRFDSTGGDHMNHEYGNGLPSRRVPSPHFHRVDNDGWLRAYQVPPLGDPPSDDAIRNDPTLGTNLFCQEFKLVSPGEGAVVLNHITDSMALASPGRLDTSQFP